jgi:hypothetical protein
MPIKLVSTTVLTPVQPPDTAPEDISADDDFPDIQLTEDDPRLLSTLMDDLGDGEDEDFDVLSSEEDELDEEDQIDASAYDHIKTIAEHHLGSIAVRPVVKAGERYLEVNPAAPPTAAELTALSKDLAHHGHAIAKIPEEPDTYKIYPTPTAAVASSEDILMYDLLVAYFAVVPEPTDDQFHMLANALGITPEDLEAQVYRIMGVMFNDDAGVDADELKETLDEDPEALEPIDADVTPYTPADGEPDGAPDLESLPK